MTQGEVKKPFYKRPWFIAVAVVFGLGALGKKERRAAGEGGAGMSGEAVSSAHGPGAGNARAGSAGRGGAVGGGEAGDEGAKGRLAEGAAGGGGAAVGGGAGGGATEDKDEGEGAAEGRWAYAEREDVMTGQVTRSAWVKSRNTHEFGFPYGGGARGEVTLRRHPRHGMDVMVSVDRGQILCSSYNGCRVMVRFDDREAIRFKGAEPADHGSTTVFLEPAAKFVKEAKRSKRAAVELEFFQEGTRVFLFDVAGLVWE